MKTVKSTKSKKSVKSVKRNTSVSRNRKLVTPIKTSSKEVLIDFKDTVKSPLFSNSFNGRRDSSKSASVKKTSTKKSIERLSEIMGAS